MDDTPYHTVNFGCPSPSTNTCPSQPGFDPIHNYMNYTDDPCMWELTSGQNNRSSSIVSQYKQNLGGTTLYFYSDFTISSNQNWNFQHGVTLKFDNGISFVVNGTLNVNGQSGSEVTFDRSGASGTWGGIQFNSGSDGDIYYANIKYATQAIKFNNLGLSYIEISNCTIENNSTYGIYLYNSSPIISYNTIQNNGSYGINCYYYSSPSIHNNTISGHSVSGVYLNYYSPAYLSYWSSGPGDNLITGNTKGVYANYQCNAFIYWNSIYGNSSYELEGYQPLTIDAEYNWWGSYPPNSSEIYTSQGAVIDYNPALSSNPLGGSLKIVSADIVNNRISSSTAVNNNTALEKAWELQLLGKYEEAIELYNSVLEKEQNTEFGRYALVRIEECYWHAKKPGFTDFIDRNINTRFTTKNELNGIAIELLNRKLMEADDYKNVLLNNDKILNDYSKYPEMRKYALFNEGYVYLTYLYDRNTAEALFTQLASEFPDDQLVHDSKLLLGLGDNGYAIRNENIDEGKTSDNSITDNPTECKLLTNYPNPFNPTTIIEYQLPESGLVTIKVYDILGKEITTLVKEHKEAGVHTAEFNAGNLPSGVYICQITAGNTIQAKKMILTK